MNAVEFLKQLKKWDLMIANKRIEIEQWRGMASGTTAQMGGERVQTSSSQQKMADTVCRYIDLEKEYERAIEHLYKLRKEVIGVIEMLEADEYDVLHRIYVQYQSLSQVAEAHEHKSVSWARQKRDRGIRNVQKILGERGMVDG